MKILTILTVLLFFTIMSNAQENDKLVAKGDIVVLGIPEGLRYEHINLPRRNVIIKRGAIANFKALATKT